MDYFVGSTSGTGAGAGWISWKWGSGRRRGGLASPVQQQDAAKSAKTEAVSAERMRIMGSDAVGLIGMVGDGMGCERWNSTREPGSGTYFVGLT